MLRTGASAEQTRHCVTLHGTSNSGGFPPSQGDISGEKQVSVTPARVRALWASGLLGGEAEEQGLHSSLGAESLGHSESDLKTRVVYNLFSRTPFQMEGGMMNNNCMEIIGVKWDCLGRPAGSHSEAAQAGVRPPQPLPSFCHTDPCQVHRPPHPAPQGT